MIVLSVLGGPGAQELLSMMFNLKNRPILCARTRQEPRGVPKPDGLENRGSHP